MKTNRYLVDFDTEVSIDNKTLKLLRNNEVFETMNGSDAVDFLKILHKITELEAIGFSYCFLEYDGKIDEWYEKQLVEHSPTFDGVTLMYHPALDLFEVPENEMKFTEMVKAEQMIKAFKQ